MRKSIQLNVPTPCHENWYQMTPLEKGRFCGSCQKQVVDFTNMSDEQLALFFKSRIQNPSKSGSVCGRFMQDQLDRSIDIPWKRIPWVKYFFQFLLPGFLMSCGGKTIGKIKVTESKTEVVTESSSSLLVGAVIPEISTLPDTTITGTSVVFDKTSECNNINDAPSVGEGILTDDDTSVWVQGDVAATIIGEIPKDITIKGNVIGDNGLPVPYANVFVKGTTVGVAADSAGNFSFSYTGGEDSIVLEGSCVGFQNAESTVRLNTGEERVTISLDARNMLGEVVVVSPYEMKESLIFTGAVAVIKEKSFSDTIRDKVFPAKQAIKLYPNPLKTGASLTIEMSKIETGAYLFQLAAVNGQVVLSKEIWMDKNDPAIKVDVPSVAAGTYLASIINKQSGKAITEKIIIE